MTMKVRSLPRPLPAITLMPIAASGFVAERLRGIRLSHENLAEDLFADAAYRAHLAEVCARKAVALASGPAPGVMVLSHGR